MLARRLAHPLLMVAAAASAVLALAPAPSSDGGDGGGCSASVDRDPGDATVPTGVAVTVSPGCAGLAVELAGQGLTDPHATGLAGALRGLIAEGRSPAALRLSNNGIGDVGAVELAMVLSSPGAKVYHAHPRWSFGPRSPPPPRPRHSTYPGWWMRATPLGIPP